MLRSLIAASLVITLCGTTELESMQTKMRTEIVDRLSEVIATKVNVALIEATAKNLTDVEIEDNFEANFTSKEIEEYYEVVDLVQEAFDKWKDKQEQWKEQEERKKLEKQKSAKNKYGRRPSFDAWDNEPHLTSEDNEANTDQKEEL